MTSEHHAHRGPGDASPAEAMRAPREEVVYVAALHTGTGVEEPDFRLFTVEGVVAGWMVAGASVPG